MGWASWSCDHIITSFRILQDNMCGSVAIPLRMIEVFTDPKIVTEESIKCAILEHLSKHGKYYSVMCLNIVLQSMFIVR